MEDNEFNKKWKTPEERIEACKEFCDHLRKGLSWSCWPGASRVTIHSYMRKHPKEFPLDLIDSAEREGMLKLEKAGVEAATGHGKRIDTKAWQFIMMNRAKWTTAHQTDHTSNGETMGVIELPARKKDAPKKEEKPKKKEGSKKKK